jgi:hypothetical protein
MFRSFAVTVLHKIECVLSQGTAETEKKTFVMIETVFFVRYELRLKKELSTDLRT